VKSYHLPIIAERYGDLLVSEITRHEPVRSAGRVSRRPRGRQRRWCGSSVPS
jgi:hypothetical protein